MKRISSPSLTSRWDIVRRMKEDVPLSYLCIKTKPEEASVNLLFCEEEASPLTIFLLFSRGTFFLLHFSRMDKIIPLWCSV